MVTEEQFGYALAKILKKELEKRNLSYIQFAKMIGSSRQAIYYFISGVNRPKGYLFMNMIEALGVNPEEFLAEIQREAERYA